MTTFAESDIVFFILGSHSIPLRAEEHHLRQLKSIVFAKFASGKSQQFIQQRGMVNWNKSRKTRGRLHSLIFLHYISVYGLYCVFLNLEHLTRVGQKSSVPCFSCRTGVLA